VRYGRDTIYLGGDIIIGIDDKEINTLSDLFNALQNTKPGDIVTVTVVRGRRTVKLEVPLIRRPAGIALN
jgi:S1-C subfamily serine protease